MNQNDKKTEILIRHKRVDGECTNLYQVDYKISKVFINGSEEQIEQSQFTPIGERSILKLKDYLDPDEFHKIKLEYEVKLIDIENLHCILLIIDYNYN